MYARWVHHSELLSFIKSIQAKNEKNYLKNKSYLQKRKDEILKTFDLVADKYKNEYQSQIDRIASYYNAHFQDNCTCGADVYYVESHGFYGCKNYKDKSVQHLNFRGKDVNHVRYYTNREPYVNTNQWVSEIRSLSGIDKSVSTANVFEFLIENGKYDISLQYNKRPTEDIVNRFKGAKKRSLDFEEQARLHLVSLHPNDKVNSQQAIKYKYFDEQEKFAICDFIVTTEDTVIIYEAKLDSVYIDEVQKEKYIDLVSYLINSKNLNFKLDFRYIVKSPYGTIKVLEG